MTHKLERPTTEKRSRQLIGATCGSWLTMLDDRAVAIFAARAYLAESHRRGRQPFAFVLLEWAANARRRAAVAPAQRRLFG